MYSTTGIDAIATITELRAKTSELLDHVRENKTSVLIQKNNEAYAVLVDWETYKALLEGKQIIQAKPLERGERTTRKRGRRKKEDDTAE